MIIRSYSSIKGNYEEVVDTLPAYIYLIYNKFMVDIFEMTFWKPFWKLE